MTTLEQLLTPINRPRTDPRVNIELPEELKADLVAYAKAHNTTISRVIRALITLHLRPESNSSRDETDSGQENAIFIV
ncbi:DUF2274 domain-containing protein [Paraburkholderia terrae]|uniref:DUF2274 domain-containing protein n=1 Tax=Paraburkholderia terrae TaxID=311230 RepID=UPI00206BB5E0|nr:DUF2274 domain-containing protein [Paraburkholderia terrae]BDC37899.1 hypothetical protein PTKU15_11960 [Paraburkholderia terrae]